MIVNLHKKARTTPEIRREIQASTLSERELARTYGVSRPTIRKWKQREEVFDRSHRPHRLSATLSPEQEAVVVELRTTLKLSVDDLLVVVREFIHAGVSRSGLDRCLRRHGVSNLAALRAQDEGVPPPRKSFRVCLAKVQTQFASVFLSIAMRIIFSAVPVRISKSLLSLRNRPSQANVRSTTQRFGRTAHPSLILVEICRTSPSVSSTNFTAVPR